MIIVTGDLDALQLVTEHVRVFANRRGISDTIVYDVDQVFERYGFAPPLVVDFKALRGDISDNIPGVPGIGDKTAMSLVQEHGPLEAILDAVPAMKEGKVKRLLTEYADQARLSKQLATIQLDMDISLDIEGSRLGPHDDEAVREVFDRLEFRSLLGRIPTYGAPACDGPGAPRRRRRRSGQGSLIFDAVPEAVDVVVVDEHGAGGGDGRAPARARATSRCAPWSRAARAAATWSASRSASMDGARPRVLRPPRPRGRQRRRTPVLEVLARLLGDASIVKHGYDLKQELLAWTRARRRGCAALGLRLHAGRLPVHHHAHARALADRCSAMTSAGSPNSPRRRCSAAGERGAACVRGARGGGGRSTTATWWRWSPPVRTALRAAARTRGR